MCDPPLPAAVVKLTSRFSFFLSFPLFFHTFPVSLLSSVNPSSSSLGFRGQMYLTAHLAKLQYAEFFTPPYSSSFYKSHPPLIPLSPTAKMELDQSREEERGDREKEREKTLSLGFIEIFIVQGWLAKLNIYADLTRLFNLCLGKYVS